MTQQFKFGDIVRDASLGVCVVINTSEHFAYIMNSRGDYNTLANPADLELTPHPDTERIDWLAAQDDIDITLGNVINLKQPDLRTAIDIAMQACIAAVAIKFTAHFEEMVARGEAERLPDGRYQIFEKAT